MNHQYPEVFIGLAVKLKNYICMNQKHRVINESC